MPSVRIAELLANPVADPEAHLDAARVQHYVEHPDQPAVVVFDTTGGLLRRGGIA
jgi:hypothetical protein